MKLGTRQNLATGTALAAIGLIAAAILWTEAEVADANRQRVQTAAISQALTEQRLVTFEYLLNRPERAQVQWYAVSNRIDRLIAGNHFNSPGHKEILAGLRDRRAAPRLFEELAAAPAANLVSAASGATSRRFEAQLVSRLLMSQQESYADAHRLTGIAAERIAAAQQQLMIVILASLSLIALLTAGMWWLIRHDVLAPIVRLQRATQEIAAGNWNFSMDTGGNNEIGELSRNFHAMTRSLRASFAQIERSNRGLAALNGELEAFSYSVSHDLRAPLRSVDGFSAVLLEDHAHELGAAGRNALQHIRAASQRMARLIDDLLGLSRVTRAALQRTPVDLSAIAREIAAAIEREQPGRPVQWLIEDGVVLQADAGLIRIALQNLLENAWKFTSKMERPVIRVGTLERDRRQAVFVADNGAGFDMAHAQRLFGAFQRLHRATEFPGTGIGLAIVQRIVLRHEGRIWTEAAPGKGATFFFTLDQPAEDARG